MAQHVTLILTTELRGTGTPPDDPVRRVIQLWTFDGELVAEHDPEGESWFSGVPCSG